MDRDKQRQEISLIGRILSMEGLVFLMGFVSLIHGLVRGEWVSLCLGILILCGMYLVFKRQSADILRKRK
ncbi:MAG: hypothetical protein CXR30_14490 [Geobacter sp.]|nr:MAG: hypothetical protein CXR30_14490 [Geobacter sp.]